MAYQLLNGIQVTPKGNYNLSRFAKTLTNGRWPTSFAFNGWIYNASCDIGFSSQPTEIKLSIVLEMVNMTQQYAFFDINQNDLRCDAGNGQDENLYDIEFNGVQFQDFILYEYEISIENNAKILNITFRDYSVILDKIYIGLIKRQGNAFVNSSIAYISFPVICPDCYLAGDAISKIGNTTRSLDYGSYVGINGNIYDNFENISDGGNIFLTWAQLFNTYPSPTQFDLNGGYLVLGTEEATEERCGDLAPISYNFNELLASLRFRGLNFGGQFPVANTDADYIYRQNYVGSLREVLGQWCSDLGYDFYCLGKTFVGINLNKALDISKVVEIADPTTDFGSNFSINKNSAILSYKAKTSLGNTFKQSVITTNNRPRAVRIDSKAPKRYVGYIPLHPIDFNRHSNDLVIRQDAFGNDFLDIAWSNSFDVNSQDLNKTLPELDGRTYDDIDTAIALSHYDDALRDIYCQDRALYGETQDIQQANFAALGMVPLIELTDDDKSMAIEHLVSTANTDDVSNLCLDKRFYRVFIGYYYQNFKNDIVSWEQEAGNSMYKYGILAKGLLNRYPYMPENSLNDESPTAGFYGESGTSLLRIQHSVEPAATQYYSLRLAPFKDLVLYSGQLTPTNYALPLQPNTTLNASGQIPIFPTGLFYTQLDNDWGLSLDLFKRQLSLNLDDPCVKEFGQDPSTTDLQNSIPNKYQDWNLSYFRPVASPNIQDFFHYSQALDNLVEQTTVDRVTNVYYDLKYHEQQECSKLHIMVLTDTRQHPNILVEFNKSRGNAFVNPIVLQMYIDKEREAVKRRIQTKTLSVCDLTLLQELCRDALYTQWQLGPPTGDSQFGCVLDEDKFNFLEDGFPYDSLTIPNSRGLGVRIVKNPIRNNDIDLLTTTFKDNDINGDFYYSDVINNFVNLPQSEASVNIIYPVSFGASAAYRGVLTSNVDLENRTPEIVQIFGQPVNSPNNNTTTIKMINNNIEPDLQPQLDPFAERFVPYMTIITGADAQIITSIQQYHNFIQQLDSYELTNPMKTIDLTLAGTPNDFGTFKNYLQPIYGLNKISMNVGDAGVITSLSFSDRPKILPKQESILNKIIMRIK